MSAVGGTAPLAGPRRAPFVAPVLGRAADRLRVVPAATARASSGTFALLVAALLAGGLLGLLALNMAIAQGAFATTDAARRQAALADREEQLSEQVARLEAPQQLALAAMRLGMVPTRNPAFIDPRTGRVLGVPLPGVATASRVKAPAPSAATKPTTATKPTATAGPTAATTPSATAGATPTATPRPTAAPTPTVRATPSPSGTR